MSIRRKTDVFQASDGTEFHDIEEAEKYEAIQQAWAEVKSAKNNLKKLLLQSQKTKDGVPFEFSCIRPYWILFNYIGSTPYLETVEPWFHHIEIDDGCEASFLFTHPGQDNRVRNYETVLRSYKVNELYHYKENAEKALIEAIEEHIKDLQLRIGKTET